MADVAKLRSRLKRKPIVVAPGVYDAFTALVAEQSGFTTLYVSGAAISYTRLGRPDIGLVSVCEVVEIVSADTGYGNALNVARTMRLFERAGASAIQLEDQDFPKRCGHLEGKVLIPPAEMAAKIKAAVDARRSRETLVIARTDAIAVEGFEHAVERAALYRDAGADVLFVEAPKTRAELKRIPPALDGVPLMANMVEGGKTPVLSAAELESMGFALVIFPGGIVRALARMAREYYASLAAGGTSEPFRSRMLDFTGLNELIGTPEMLALGKQYDSLAQPSGRKRGTRR